MLTGTSECESCRIGTADKNAAIGIPAGRSESQALVFSDRARQFYFYDLCICSRHHADRAVAGLCFAQIGLSATDCAHLGEGDLLRAELCFERLAGPPV